MIHTMRHTEIVKILAPMISVNPNESKSNFTPIEWAENNGHIEIVKILAPLSVNPNESKSNYTPIQHAANNGHTEIVKILAPLSE